TGREISLTDVLPYRYKELRTQKRILNQSEWNITCVGLIGRSKICDRFRIQQETPVCVVAGVRVDERWARRIRGYRNNTIRLIERCVEGTTLGQVIGAASLEQNIRTDRPDEVVRKHVLLVQRQSRELPLAATEGC